MPLSPIVDMVKAECYRLCQTKAEADDLCQMTLYKIIKNHRQIEHPESLMAWVYRILMNAYIDQKRRRRRETPFSRLMNKSDPFRVDLDENSVSSYILGADEISRKCFDRLSSVLSPMEKRILDLTTVQGIVSRDVCTALGLSPSKIARVKMRAKEKMRAAAGLSDLPPTWMS